MRSVIWVQLAFLIIYKLWLQYHLLKKTQVFCLSGCSLCLLLWEHHARLTVSIAVCVFAGVIASSVPFAFRISVGTLYDISINLSPHSVVGSDISNLFFGLNAYYELLCLWGQDASHKPSYKWIHLLYDGATLKGYLFGSRRKSLIIHVVRFYISDTAYFVVVI